MIQLQAYQRSGAFSSASPRLQLVWDSTSLSYLKECPRKYEYAMIRGLATNGENIHFTFGAFYHRGQELFHKARATGCTWEQAVDSTLEEVLRLSWGWTSSDRHKNRERLIGTLIFSFCEQIDDPVKTKLLANGAPAVELSFKLNSGLVSEEDEPFLLAGHIDRVCVIGSGDEEEEWIEDYKTTKSSLNTDYFSRYSPDNQMTLYYLFGKVGLARPVRGILVQGTQILANASRFLRGFIHRTPSQLEEWLHDLQYWLGLAESFAAAAYYPMNDKSCHNYGGCPFAPTCRLSPEMRDGFLKSNYTERLWDPTINR